jgi:hypothetical protein
MKYITTSGAVTEPLSLGAIGQTKTYRITGNATFPDGSKQLITNGLVNVNITIAPNRALQARFVEVSESGRRIETYCVLSPAAERWSLAALRGIGNHLDWNSSGICVINLVTNVETVLAPPATDADPWLDYILVPDAAGKRVWALRSNPTLTVPTVGRQIPIGAVTVATGISRNANDQRTHLFVDVSGRIHQYDHRFSPLRADDIGVGVRNGAFTYANGVATAFIFVGDEGALKRVTLGANFAPNAVDVLDSTRIWTRVQTDPQDGSRVYCVSDAAVDNAFTYGTELSAAFAGEAYTGLGLTDTGFMHGVYRKMLTDTTAVAVSYNACAGQLLYPASGKYLSTDGKRYEAGTLTGNLPDGRTLLGIIYLNNVAHAVCAMSPVVPLRTDSSKHSTTLTIAKKETAANWMTLFVDVVGDASEVFPIALPDGATATVTVNDAPVLSARNGQQLKIVVDTNSIRDNLFTLAVGRNALAEPMIPDELPDAFVIEDIYNIRPQESKTTVAVTPVAYDTAIPVHSNGIILLDGVEVADGTLIRPGQSLAIRIIQSDEFVDHWWVTLGELRVTFSSIQDDQPVTSGIKSRAYMPLGEFVSRAIENTYGVRVILTLTSDVGAFDNTDERSIVLGPNQTAFIKLDVTEHTHYEIPYKFGRTDHVLRVWADDHFLDTEPVTEAAARYVIGTSPAFPFTSIPDGFYAVAKTPAGVWASLDGDVLPADSDARGFNKAEELIEFDLDQPLTYRAIPFADGRTLDFGDVVARWHYDPVVNSIKLEKQQLLKVPVRDTVVNVDSLVTIPRTPIADHEPNTFALYPLRKHQTFTRPESSSYSGVGFQRNAVPKNSGIQTPKFDHNEFTVSNVARPKGQHTQRQEVRTFADLDFQIVSNTHAAHSHAPAAPKFRQLRHVDVESSNFTYMKRNRAETQRSGYAEVRAHRAAALGLTANAVAARNAEGLSLDANVATPKPSYTVEALDALGSVNRTALTLELDATFAPVSKKQYLELNAAQKQILGLTSWQPEARSARFRQPDTIPIRALYKQARRRSVAVEARSFVFPKLYEMADPIPGVSWHTQCVSWQLSLAATYSQVGHARTADAAAPNHVESTTQVTAEMKPAIAIRVNSFSRMGSTSAFSPSSAVTSHAPRTGEFVQTATQSFEGRKIEFNLATSHDGNPDLLDRGYFATEVEALQNAVRVWKMEPSDVVARQLPTGQWYWATPDLCVNMCVECPPYGYLSGG